MTFFMRMSNNSGLVCCSKKFVEKNHNRLYLQDVVMFLKFFPLELLQILPEIIFEINHHTG